MKELLEIFDLNWNYIQKQERTEFYTEIKAEYDEKWIISRQVKRIVCMIITPSGNIILQKRSDDKNENPWMYDKSIGGHIAVMEKAKKENVYLSQELSDLNMAKEWLEELAIPSYVTSHDLFIDALDFDVERMAFITRIERIMWQKSVRIKQNWDKFIQPYISDIYMWYYNGHVRFKDAEASGLEYVDIDKLKRRILDKPKNYTEDLKFLIQRYGRYFVNINKFKEVFKENDGFYLPYVHQNI